MNILPFEKQVHVIELLTEGCSVRGVERLLDTHRDTIGRLALRVGEGCSRIHDEKMRNLNLSNVQLDEQHSYVHTRQVHLKDSSTPEHGEQWTFAALDVQSRAVVDWLIGKRTADNTRAFVDDLRRRLKTEANLAGDIHLATQPTVAADGFPAYPNAIELAFGTEVAFGQLVKVHQVEKIKNKRIRRIVEAKIAKEGEKAKDHYKHAVRVPIKNNPNEADIHTSYIERMNLTTRTCMRRFMRRTAGGSKRLRNHAAAVALQYTYYNFVRVHSTLSIIPATKTTPAIRLDDTTPAMKLGVTDHVWSLSELVALALGVSTPPPLPPIVKHIKNLPKHSKWQGVDPERVVDRQEFTVLQHATWRR